MFKFLVINIQYLKTIRYLGKILGFVNTETKVLFRQKTYKEKEMLNFYEQSFSSTL